MDADALSLLIILRQELQAIAKGLQPEPQVIEDIMTDNGLMMEGGNVSDSENNPTSSPLPAPPPGHDDEDDSHDEEEKAPELKRNAKKSNLHQVGYKIDDLIQNYLIPSIKQLNSKQKKQRKKSNVNGYNQHETNQTNTSYSPSPQKMNHNHNSPAPALLFGASSYPPPPNSHNNNNFDDSNIINHGVYNGASCPNLRSVAASASSIQSEPGQVIDQMANYSEKLGNCCRKFFTSLICGCGLFQCIGVLVVLAMIVTVFVFYKTSEFTLILKEINHWKELSVKRIEYELANEQKLAQLNFDENVDIDKVKQEHKHVQTMEIIEAKKALTQEFIDRNTRTVTTTYWNFLTQETEVVSQTIFSEDDIAIFQNAILQYGFHEAIKAPENAHPLSQDRIDDKAHYERDIDGGNEDERRNNAIVIEDDRDIEGDCNSSYDSFDAI